MKDGTIILFEEKNSKNLIYKLQYFIYKSWVIHVALYFEGRIYESGVFRRFGFLHYGFQSDRPLSEAVGKKVMSPYKELTVIEKVRLRMYISSVRNFKYAGVKALFMIFMYGIRKTFHPNLFYKKSFLCTDFVNLAYLSLGRNILPDVPMLYTYPIDYEDLKGFEKVVCYAK
jgi:hypothetical protein